ncbi:uncharacterized protein LOC134840392 [Symsagittifera roscoffensis]|uniref:uncharacterized protein LOC134840392 n=1 Tax=Symsagittifera roscoffensis TaxID=84072 RepID=UPI00307B530E
MNRATDRVTYIVLVVIAILIASKLLVYLQANPDVVRLTFSLSRLDKGLVQREQNPLSSLDDGFGHREQSPLSNMRKKTKTLWQGDHNTAEYLNHVQCSDLQKEELFCIGHPGFCAKMNEYTRQGRPNDGKLCRLFNGSDKCELHKYADVYDFIFRDIRHEEMEVLEIGIGSQSLQFTFTMSSKFTIGASQRAWRDYFPKSQIYAADIDPDVLFEEERIKSFYVDILKNKTLDEMIVKIGSKLDILVDDSLHSVEGQNNLISVAYEWIKPGGYYVVEDVVIDTICTEMIKTLLKKGINDFAYVKTADTHHKDSVLQIIRKPDHHLN